MLCISFFHSATNVSPLVGQGTWSELVALLADWQRFEQQRCRKKSHPAMVLAEIMGVRRNDNVVAIYGLAADIDTPPTDPQYRSFEDMTQWLMEQGWAFVIYTTTKSSSAHHRYRIVLVFEHSIDRGRHLAAWMAVNDKLGGIIDTGTKDPARLSFLPAHWRGEFRDDRTGEVVAFPEGFNAFASHDGAPVLTKSELASLTTAPIQPRSRSKVAQTRGRSQRGPNVVEATDPPASVKQHWEVLIDWRRSPYIADWMRDIADEPGQREFRFMCAVARNALRRGLWINAALLTDIGESFSLHGLDRQAPIDLSRQARNALDFAKAEPPQPDAGPRRSDTDNSTRNR